VAGAQVVLKMMATAALQSAVYGAVFGETSYNPFGGEDDTTGKKPTVPTYSLINTLTFSPERPGYKQTVQVYSNITEFFGRLGTANYEDLKRNAKWFERNAIQYSLIMPWVGRYMEARGNYRGMKNAYWLQQYFQGMNEEARRTGVENWIQHFALGTAEEHDPRRDLDLFDEIGQRLMDGETMVTPTLRKLINAGDSPQSGSGSLWSE